MALWCINIIQPKIHNNNLFHKIEDGTAPITGGVPKPFIFHTHTHKVAASISAKRALPHPESRFTLLGNRCIRVIQYDIIVFCLEHKPGRIKPGRMKRAALSLQKQT